jgi:hypothetical protein
MTDLALVVTVAGVVLVAVVIDLAVLAAWISKQWK